MAKGTLNGTRRKKLSKVGFRARMRTVGGRRILKNRRNKGRKLIAMI